MEHMTLRQKWILKYVATQFHKGAVHTYPIGEDMLVIRDRTGDRLVLAADDHGNISDAESRRLIALSNAAPGSCASPSAWTPVSIVIRQQ